jgi:hypothetical protein
VKATLILALSDDAWQVAKLRDAVIRLSYAYEQATLKRQPPAEFP